jgi:hypothetical protein
MQAMNCGRRCICWNAWDEQINLTQADADAYTGGNEQIERLPKNRS